MKFRLAAAEAAVQQANNEAKLVPPDAPFTTERYDRLNGALLGAINDAISGFTSPNPFANSNTSMISCDIKTDGMDRCMTADALQHEHVHQQVCEQRKEGLNIIQRMLNNPRKGVPFIKILREEQAAYGAEVSFLRQQLASLKGKCRGYKLDYAIGHYWPTALLNQFTRITVVMKDVRICPIDDGWYMSGQWSWALEVVGLKPLSCVIREDQCRIGEFSFNVSVNDPKTLTVRLFNPFLTNDLPQSLPLIPIEDCTSATQPK